MQTNWSWGSKNAPQVCYKQIKGICQEKNLTTENRVLVWSIMTVSVAVAKEVRTGAVSVIALKLAKPAVSDWAGRGFVWAISAVPLTVTFPPNRDAPIKDKKATKSK